MSPKLGPMVFGEQQEQVFLGKNLGHERNYGEGVAELIDKEMHDMVSEAYADVLRMLSEHMDALQAMAKALMEVETINHQQVDNLVKYGTLDAPKPVEQAVPAADDAAPAEASPEEGATTAKAAADTPQETVTTSPWGNPIPETKDTTETDHKE